ncbi:hypothetical protein [Pseudocowpox virus]
MSGPYHVYGHNGDYKGTASDPGSAVKRPYSCSSGGSSSSGWGNGIWAGFGGGKKQCTGSGIFGGGGSSPGGIKSGVSSGIKSGVNSGVNGGV